MVSSQVAVNHLNWLFSKERSSYSLTLSYSSCSATQQRNRISFHLYLGSHYLHFMTIGEGVDIDLLANGVCASRHSCFFTTTALD